MDNLKINIPRLTLVDQVEDKLLEYFKNNDIKVGNSIPSELELSKALGVARSVLREALSRLKMVGMIESRTCRGMMLCEPSLFNGFKRVLNPRMMSDKKLFDILGFRVALEIGICNDIFSRITDEDLKELEEIVKAGTVLANNEYAPISEFSFHTKLYEISGNKTILEFQEIIHPVMNFVKDKFNDMVAPLNKRIEEKGEMVTHHDLLEYLKKKDEDGFKKAMEGHFAVYKLLESNS